MILVDALDLGFGLSIVRTYVINGSCVFLTGVIAESCLPQDLHRRTSFVDSKVSHFEYTNLPPQGQVPPVIKLLYGIVIVLLPICFLVNVK